MLIDIFLTILEKILNQMKLALKEIFELITNQKVLNKFKIFNEVLMKILSFLHDSNFKNFSP